MDSFAIYKMAFNKAVTQPEKARGWHFHQLESLSGASDGGENTGCSGRHHRCPLSGHPGLRMHVCFHNSTSQVLSVRTLVFSFIEHPRAGVPEDSLAQSPLAGSATETCSNPRCFCVSLRKDRAGSPSSPWNFCSGTFC